MNLDTILNLAQIVVLGGGIFVGFFAFYVSTKVHKESVIGMLRAIGVVCGVTCWFAVTSLLHTYNVMTPYQAILLRILIFGPSFLACRKVLKNLELEKL